MVFEGLYNGGQVTVLHFEVAVGYGGFGVAEGDLAVIDHQLRQGIPGAVGLGINHVFPVSAEFRGHFAAQQNGIAAGGDIDDIFERVWVLFAG